MCGSPEGSEVYHIRSHHPFNLIVLCKLCHDPVRQSRVFETMRFDVKQTRLETFCEEQLGSSVLYSHASIEYPQGDG